MNKQVSFQIFALLFVLATSNAADHQDVPSNPMVEKSNQMWMKLMETAPSVTIGDVKHKQETDDSNFVILDVRTTEEYKAGYIDGAIHADRNAVEFIASKAVPDPKTTIYLYCTVGARAASATMALLDLGYERVYNISGGIHAWASAGYPVHNELGEFVYTETAPLKWQK